MPSATAFPVQLQLAAGRRRNHQGNTEANRTGRRVLELELEAGHGQGQETQGTQPMPWHVGGCWQTPWLALLPPTYSTVEIFAWRACASLEGSVLLDSQRGVGRRDRGGLEQPWARPEVQSPGLCH